MKVSKSKVLCLSAGFVGLVIAGVGMASAQDVYKVNYFSNNGVTATLPGVAAAAITVAAPDATARIDNPGLTYGNLCAMIYVFNNDQQLFECCGCVETHNGLRTLSVKNNLTNNTLTGRATTNGVVKIVSASVNGGSFNGTGCGPDANVTPKPNLRSWLTHVQNQQPLGTFGGAVWPTTETAGSDSTLGSSELANLQAQCSFIGILGSGAGVCTCGTGD